MKELWTARVHLLTPPTEFGDTKCFTNVVAWAETADDFTATVMAVLGRRGWSVLNVQRCKRASEYTSLIQEHAEQIEEARSQVGSCIFGTLNYYPSKPA
jgi:hypothetical protein